MRVKLGGVVLMMDFAGGGVEAVHADGGLHINAS